MRVLRGDLGDQPVRHTKTLHRARIALEDVLQEKYAHMWRELALLVKQALTAGEEALSALLVEAGEVEGKLDDLLQVFGAADAGWLAPGELIKLLNGGADGLVIGGQDENAALLVEIELDGLEDLGDDLALAAVEVVNEHEQAFAAQVHSGAEVLREIEARLHREAGLTGEEGLDSSGKAANACPVLHDFEDRRANSWVAPSSGTEPLTHAAERVPFPAVVEVAPEAGCQQALCVLGGVALPGVDADHAPVVPVSLRLPAAGRRPVGLLGGVTQHIQEAALA